MNVDNYIMFLWSRVHPSQPGAHCLRQDRLDQMSIQEYSVQEANSSVSHYYRFQVQPNPVHVSMLIVRRKRHLKVAEKAHMSGDRNRFDCCLCLNLLEVEGAGLSQIRLPLRQGHC